MLPYSSTCIGPSTGFVKPIFHWILGSRWPPNANEIDTNNINFYMANVRILGDPTPPIFHLLMLGVYVGGNANFTVFRYQHAAGNCGVGGLSQRQDPTQMVLRRSGI